LIAAHGKTPTTETITELVGGCYSRVLLSHPSINAACPNFTNRFAVSPSSASAGAKIFATHALVSNNPSPSGFKYDVKQC